MACLHPIKIINRSKELHYGSSRFYLYVPCGKCVECQKRKASEWSLRSYYESKHTFDKGGFILFDTLTHSPENTPHLSDFFPELKDTSFDTKCFNRRDIRLFFVRLRSELSRLGYDCKDGLKYFLASEYGVDDRFTHQPHYHVMFHVRFDISPFTFSELVAKCWPYGRTDGVPYNGRQYVLSKRLFSPRYNGDLIHLQNCCSYCCKYIMKDSEFEKRVIARVDDLMAKFYGDCWRKDEHAKSFYYSIARNAFQFHLQSKHFGECALDYLNKDDITSSGKMSMPDRFLVRKFMQTPVYFQRKLMQTLTRDFRGEKVWRLTDTGKDVAAESLYNRIKRFASDVDGWLNSLSPAVRSQMLVPASFDSEKFSIYINLYRGLVSPYEIGQSNNILSDPFSMTSVSTFVHNVLFSPDSRCVYNYLVGSDAKYIGSKCLLFSYQGDSNHPQEIFSTSGILYDDFISHHIITEKSSPEFFGFDRLFNFYCLYLAEYNKFKQSSFDEVNLLTKKFQKLCVKSH